MVASGNVKKTKKKENNKEINEKQILKSKYRMSEKPAKIKTQNKGKKQKQKLFMTYFNFLQLLLPGRFDSKEIF
jgi:hypothetical protein